jgi:hypothetical protein
MCTHASLSLDTLALCVVCVCVCVCVCYQVSCMPATKLEPRSGSHELLFLGCDGIFDVLTAEEILHEIVTR